VSGLLLLAESKHDRTKKWAFTCFVEVAPTKLLQRGPEQSDAERMAGFFAGFAVPPGDSVRVDPMFIPIHDAEGRIVSRESMVPGSYLLRVFLYSAAGQRMFVTSQIEYTLAFKNIGNALSKLGNVQLGDAYVDRRLLS
jgi:hypothetical protein